MASEKYALPSKSGVGVHTTLSLGGCEIRKRLTRQGPGQSKLIRKQAQKQSAG